VNKFVVTGAAGFIGSQILRRLLKDGVSPSEIVAVDLSRKLFSERACSADFSKQGIHYLDYLDFLARYWKGEILPVTIFHMGACSSTDETRTEVLDEQNLTYSKRLWTIATQKQSKLIYASSAATYGDGGNGFSDDPERLRLLKPLNLYGWSKQHFDLFVSDELKSSRSPKIWGGLKFFNVYGPGEAHKGSQASVVFHARNQIRAQGTLKLFQSHKEGILDGEQKRDFVFVDDCVDVALSMAQGLVEPGIYNVGSGVARSFNDLGRAVFKNLNVPEKIEYIPTPETLRPHYQYFTCASLNRLRQAGFRKDMTSLESGIEKYIASLS
jgi:ADP-L-glycero-D-manno-heptose 6-epimerase